MRQLTAQVPVLTWTNDVQFLEKFKLISNPSHWEIGKQILNLMGYEIKNPNNSDDTIFIQGSDPTGAAGFLTLERKGSELVEIK